MSEMTSTRGRPVRARVAALAALLTVATAGVLAGDVPAAHAAPPVVANGASPNQWLESFSVPKDTNGQDISLTLVVQHDLGRVVNRLAVDDDWDGSDETASTSTWRSVSATTLPGGPSNYSAVRYRFTPPNMPGFSCGIFSGTRRVNQNLRVRAVLDDNSTTSTLTASVHSVENNQCLAVTDFPYLRDQSQTATEITPGQSVTFTFQGDDVDSSGGNDRLDKMRWRVRRMSDGAIVQGPTNVGGLNDNTNISLNVTFPQRGRYVVEAELGGEDDGFGDFENAGRFFRIGAVDVNTAAGTSPTVSLSNPGVVQNTPFGSANVTVNASASDATDLNGRVQMIRWDADGATGFERREVAANEATGLTAAQLASTPSLTGCANRTFTAEVTDNGALNGADAIRRTRSASTTVDVNCPPVASDRTASTPEDTPAGIGLVGSEPDGDLISWSLTSGPAHGSASVAGSTAGYTPAPNFHGTDSFGVAASDGRGGTDTATVTVTVTPVNDIPVSGDVTTSTAEDVPIDITMPASDVDGDPLSFTAGPAGHGTVSVVGNVASYTPAQDYNGPDAFAFVASDGHGGTDTGHVGITVTPVQDSPTANDLSVTTPEDSSLAVTLTGSDPDGDPLTFAVSSGPGHGTLTGAAPNVTYVPDADFNGTDAFTFQIDDGLGGTDTGTVTITVAPVNDPPVAADQAVTTPEDTPLAVLLTGSDVDGDALTLSVAAPTSHGSVSCDPSGTCLYTPATNYFGPDAFTFQVADGNGGFDTGLVTIDVTPVNDPPVADDLARSTPEDAPIGTLLTATDVEDDRLTFTVVSAPTHGVLSGSGPNRVYTPGLNFNGPDAFTFEVDDGNGGSDTGLVSVTVTPVNDAPAAFPQSLSTAEDTPVAITLTGDDVDGDSISFAVVTGPGQGALAGIAPDLTYTPAADFNGFDSLVFRVTDPSGASDTATVVVTVGDPGTNDPPVAGDQDVATAEDTPRLIVLTGGDADGDPLTFTVDTAPAHGVLTGTAPNVVYTPALNYHGPDTLVFRADDGHGGTDVGVVAITVTSVNDAPDAVPQIVIVPEDTATPVVLGGTDADGDALSLALVSPPSQGAVAGTVPNLTYTPALDFEGFDSFSFEVTDGHGGRDVATVSLDVRAAPKVRTSLVATPAVAQVVPGPQVYFPALTATLSNRTSDSPIAGKTVTFTAGTATVCAAVTDAGGVATCSAFSDGLAALTGLGYNAFFAGDADHLAASDAAPLVQVFNLPVP